MPIGVSAAPYAKFKNPGDRHGGEIVDFRIVQTVEYDSKRPQYLEQNDEDGSWSRSFKPFRESDGKPNDPIVQYEITVDTGVEDANGDAELRIFVDPRKGRRNTLLEGRRGGDALAIALKKAKAHRVGLEIGGRFFLEMGEQVKDGSGPKTNTWTAEYTPPPGGPGSGKPVDETPWLVGGGRYDKATELNKWESSQVPALREALARSAPTSAPTPAKQAPSSSIWPTNHASSPVVNRNSAPVADDEEIPF